MRSTLRRRRFESGAVFALLLTMGTSAFGQGEAETLSSSFRKAARRAMPAVVSVRPLGSAVAGPFPSGSLPPPGAALPGIIEPGFRGPGAGGSGVVIDAEKGYVLTNDHVVDGATRVAVVLSDGRERIASQVRRDPKSDLALLIIDGKGLTQAEWGDSEALDVGDWVLAIGQPLGLPDTVTAGIVSGKSRGVGMTMYEDLIQTDAAINPGNSGGPLINLRGEVVGINSAIKTRSGGFEGIGFAVPASRARRVAADLAESGKVRRAYLGINIGTVDPTTAEKLNQPGAVLINGVTPDSPAADAGLRRGDVIVGLQGKPVANIAALQTAIEVAKVGEPLTLTINRGGEVKEIKVTPAEQPERFGLRLNIDVPATFPRLPALLNLPAVPLPALRMAPTSSLVPELGMWLGEPVLAQVPGFILRSGTAGLRVIDMSPGGPAERAGLKAGMVIVQADQRPLFTIDDLRNVLAGRDADKDVVLQVSNAPKVEYRLRPEPADAKAPAPTEPKPAEPKAQEPVST